MTKLHISPKLGLPTDTVTSTLIVYGGKGMGKTNFGAVLVEELTKAHQRWCALDPMGVWYGVRHSADGKGEGIECVILGGPHGDLPILPTGGAVVADFVVDEEVNVLIDYSRKPSGELWSIGEKVRFVTEYALRIFQRQGELVDGRRRPPLMQVLDEAARYIPQIIPSGNPELAKSVGAWEQLAEEGRNVGVGVAFLTQRSARINKSVAELADAMLAFRTVGPNSVGAVIDWLGEHIERKKANEYVEQVRKLPVGHALVVSPGWLEFEGVVPIRLRETFDSSRTVKAGDTGPRIRGSGARPPDLAKYRTRMAETIERANADDPKALRAEIANLRKQLAAKGKVTETIVKKIERLEVPVLKDAAITRLETIAKHLGRQGEGLDRWGSTLQAVSQEILVAIGKAERSTGQRRAVTEVRERPQSAPAPSSKRLAPRPVSNLPVDGSFAPSASQQRILDVLAWLEMVNVTPAAKAQVAGLAGQSPTSGGYFNNLGRLRSAGLIDYAESKVYLTNAGRDIAIAPSVPPTNEQLHDEVCAKVSASQARILRELIAQYPGDLGKDELAERVGQSSTSGGYFNNLGRLRSLGFIEYPTQGRARAADVLFIRDAA